ncbi:MAG: hypothetical protein LBO09_06945 [Candidatus Peribacteria bacterium]|nr:hypothetical protein [Candidatus Peribacteria bacterium]
MNSVGRSIGEALQKTTQKAIGNLPIIPIGGGKTTGISQVLNTGTFLNTKLGEITENLRSKNNTAMGGLFGTNIDAVKEEKAKREEQALNNLDSAQLQSITKNIDRDRTDQIHDIDYKDKGEKYTMQTTNDQILSRIGAIEGFITHRNDINANTEITPEKKKRTKEEISSKIKEVLEETNNISTEAQLKKFIDRYKSQNDISTLKDVERTVDGGKKFKLNKTTLTLEQINEVEKPE